MLPIMVLCWVGLFFRFQGIEKYLDAAVEARRDAWVFSAQGCEVGSGETMPKGIGIDCDMSKGGAKWMQVLEYIPFINFLVDSIVGFELTKTAKREHTAPALLGGGSTDQKYKYNLACNEKSRDVTYILKSCICEQVSAMGLSLDFAVDCPQRPSRGGAVCD